jgi:hypothetical protein
MFGFSVSSYNRYSDLPLDTFKKLKYKIYILDLNWNYLFVNDVVLADLPNPGRDLIGLNMWTVFKELQQDPTFQQMKVDIENCKEVSVTTVSPLTRKRLRIFGWPLKDCYLFTVSTLPDKQELLNELRSLLNKAASPGG